MKYDATIERLIQALNYFYDTSEISLDIRIAVIYSMSGIIAIFPGIVNLLLKLLHLCLDENFTYIVRGSRLNE
jgi:hypothetical protein